MNCRPITGAAVCRAKTNGKPNEGTLINKKMRNSANQTPYSVGVIQRLATTCVAVMNTPLLTVATTSQPLWRKNVVWLSAACADADSVAVFGLKCGTAVAGFSRRNQRLFC